MHLEKLFFCVEKIRRMKGACRPAPPSQIRLTHADTGTYDEPQLLASKSQFNMDSLYYRSRRERISRRHNNYYAAAITATSTVGSIVGQRGSQPPLDRDFIVKHFRLPLTVRALGKNRSPTWTTPSEVHRKLPRGKSSYSQEFALNPELMAISRRFNNPQQHRVMSARVHRSLGIGLVLDEPAPLSATGRPATGAVTERGTRRRPKPAQDDTSLKETPTETPRVPAPPPQRKRLPEEIFLETGHREKKMLDDYIAHLEAIKKQPIRVPAPPRVPFPC